MPTISKSPSATNVVFAEDKMIILFEDGRELSVPLEWFPKLRFAKQKELLNWKFMSNGD